MKNENTPGLFKSILNYANAIGISLTACTMLTTPAHADLQIRTSSFEYTSEGFLSSETIEPNQPNFCLKTTYQYDRWGNRSASSSAPCIGATGDTLSSASTPRTSASNYGNDGKFAVSSTNALGQSETKTYDARFGAVKTLTGPNGLTTTWNYDSFGRKIQEIRADGTSTSWKYKLCSDVDANCPGVLNGATLNWLLIEQSYSASVSGTTTTTPSGPEGRQYFDTLNRVIRVQTKGFDGVVSAPTLVQDTQYNNLGQVIAKSNMYPLGSTPIWNRFQYDALGRITTESHPDSAATGSIAATRYTYSGLTTTVTNANGQTQTTRKNAQGQVISATDAAGSVITYSYDALGNLLSTNAAGSITKMLYDQRGRKISMQDPAMGSWTYSYNAFGELVRQRDSLDQTTTMYYDVLGRLYQRNEPDLISQWKFDINFDGTSCGKSIGKLCQAKATNGYDRKHTYDSLGRIASTSTILAIAASPAIVSQSYDNAGRISSKTWPTGFQASYSYSPLGYLKRINGGGSNGFTQTLSYQVLSMDAAGHVTQYKLGEKVTTVKTFDANTQRLTSQTATTDGQSNGNVLNQSYRYDSLGNIKTRVDNSPGVGIEENFAYDSLNRLTLATIVGGAVRPTTTEVRYDARGNIAYKSDVGRYWYDASRPNRMTNITLETAPGASISVTGTRALSYAFDDSIAGAQSINGTTVGNGNLTYTVSHDSTNNIHTVRYETYTSFNMPSQVVYGNFITNTSSTADRTLSYAYGPEHQRVRENVSLTGTGTSSYFAGNTWYLNGEDSLGLSYEKEVRANGTTENKHYLMAGGQVFAVFTSRTGTLNGLAASTTSYFQHDQLGSIAVVTDENGVVKERLAYDAWGKRRNIMSSPGTPDTRDLLVGKYTNRGFTEHEHLDEIGMIHMNGRIYDPLIGRFMSADSLIEAPDQLASYNRYSYVWNNPLNRVDPSGFCWICNPIGETFKTLNHIGDVIASDPVARTLVTVAIAYYTGQWATNSLGFSAIGSGALGGAASSAFASNGDINAIAVGAVTGAGFGWAGGVGGADSFARYAAHASVGCVSAVASGGSCGAGAASAVFGKYTTNAIGDIGGSGISAVIARGVATAVAGGVGAVIAGGSFENGAWTAAFGYLFNELQQARLRGIGNTYLDDKFAPRVNNWIDLSHAKGVDLTFTEAFRTTEYQAAMALNPNAITPATAGSSLHEAGFAVDVNFSSLRDIPGGLTGNQQRQIIRDTAAEAGIRWGGNFRRADPPHFYVDPGGRVEKIIDAQRRYCQFSGKC